MDDRIVRRQRLELVLRREERKAGQLGELGGDRLAEILRCVESRADGRAALRKLAHAMDHARRDPRTAARELVRISPEFLPERDRCRILQMGAPDLDDVGPGDRLRIERVVQPVERREQAPGRRHRRRDLQRRGEAVVRRLAHIDMVVRVDRRLAAALARQHLVGAAGDHLVDVHVALGAGTGLPDDQRELLVELAARHLRRGGFDRVGDLRVEPVRPVHPCRRLLHQRKRMDDADRHALGRAEREILDGALRLRAPIGVGRDVDSADRIGFSAGFGHQTLLRLPFLAPPFQGRG
ncbi:URF 4 [hydrothermal vent metagenome]|uniref:URF 4 n=1 Tax=hydrothermal vent metagenome TaxID=652676 RepID=A0A160TM08_9ZZZZ